MTLEEIKKQISKLQSEVAKIEANDKLVKEDENVFDKYGRLIEAKKDADFYVICSNSVILKQFITKNYCIKNMRDGFFKDFKSAEFALKVEMRNNILRKHGAEFSKESGQWCVTANDDVHFYSMLGDKEFYQQYFSTEELANSAIKELTENNLLKIEME